MTLQISRKIAIVSACCVALGSYSALAKGGGGGGMGHGGGMRGGFGGASHGNSGFGHSQFGNPQTGSGNSSFGRDTAAQARSRSNDHTDESTTAAKKTKK